MRGELGRPGVSATESVGREGEGEQSSPGQCGHQIKALRPEEEAAFHRGCRGPWSRVGGQHLLGGPLSLPHSLRSGSGLLAGPKVPQGSEHCACLCAVLMPRVFSL